MRSRLEQVSVRRKPVIPRGLLGGCPHSTSKVALTVLLVVASLLFAAAASIAPPAALAQGVAQDTPQGTRTVAPTPKQGVIEALSEDTPEAPGETPTGKPEPAPAETPEPPVETAEPTPSETVEPPTETIEPTPGDTPEAPDETPEPTPEDTPEPPPAETLEPPTEIIEPTPGDTLEPEATAEPSPEPEKTVEPVATEPASPTATAAPTPTRAVSIWSTDWPLGTVRVGAEESGPAAEPMQVTIGEWLQLALAVVVVTLAAILGGRVLYWFLRSTITRQHLDVDETLLVQLRPLLSWWLAAIWFHIAVRWVSFENEPARELFADLAFLAYLGVATLTAWRLVDHAIDLYANRIAAEGQAATIERLRPLMRRWVRALILLFSAPIALGRLDVGASVPTILVMLIGLGIILAARDTLTDIIAGFSILIDQPFRIGDRIEVQGVDTWAEVVNIGLRTSVLLTRHSVEIIVPNSTISKNQVINYSYPDSRYRMETHVGIAFGTNVEHARRIMIEAVRQAAYVLPDEPVEALYVEIGDSAMIFRVRWWIDFYRDWERSYDCAHTALHNALAEAGIGSPYPSQSLNVQVDDQTLAEVWQAWQGEEGTGSTLSNAKEDILT